MKSYVTYETAVQASNNELLYRCLFVMAATCLLLEVIGLWKLLIKAGMNGWYAVIPGLNLWAIFAIATDDGKKALLLLIPLFGPLYLFYVLYQLARSFGAGPWFCVLTVIIQPVGLFLIGEDDRWEYKKI